MIETGRLAMIDSELQRVTIPPEHLKIEVRRGGRWIEVPEPELR